MGPATVLATRPVSVTPTCPARVRGKERSGGRGTGWGAAAAADIAWRPHPRAPPRGLAFDGRRVRGGGGPPPDTGLRGQDGAWAQGVEHKKKKYFCKGAGCERREKKNGSGESARVDAGRGRQRWPALQVLSHSQWAVAQGKAPRRQTKKPRTHPQAHCPDGGRHEHRPRPPAPAPPPPPSSPPPIPPFLPLPHPRGHRCGWTDS